MNLFTKAPGRALATVVTAAALFAGPMPAAQAATNTIDVNLSFDHDGTVQNIDVAMFEDEVIAPGASGEALIRVHNTGSEPGMLTSSIIDVSLPAADADLAADHLLINGIPATTLIDARTVIGSQAVAPGATALLPISYEFLLSETPYDPHTPAPADGTRGLSFTVHLQKSGESPAPSPSPAPSAPPAAGGPQAVTGGEALRNSGWPFALAGMIGAFGVLMVFGKHRDDDEAATDH